MRLHRHRALAFAAALSASACDGSRVVAPVATTSASAPTARARPIADVTILYTSDEHGWLVPFTEGGKSFGSAAEMLAAWKKDEGHCVGCADPSTLALSGGDNFTGPAISSFYGGEPMAEQLGAMGYAMSAFGNHEFDFGRDQFLKNAATAKLAYVAANVRVIDPKLEGRFHFAPFMVFQRKGARIGVISVTTEATLVEAMASRFDGFAIDKEEPALDAAARAAWALPEGERPDVLIAVAHECPDKLKPMVERHPDWHLSLVLGAHCHKPREERAGEVKIVSHGWRMGDYLRVKLSIDPSRAEFSRARDVKIERVEVGAGPDVPIDAGMSAKREAWKKKVDDALGETIGFTATGFGKESPEISRWIAGAWKAELKVDVGLVNQGGIRQGLPKGPITKASVWSILPFDNKLVVLSLTGRDLLTDLTNDEARATIAAGAIDPTRKYSVGTIDFLYAGGAKFAFKAQDPSPRDLELDWREPIIAWTRRLATTANDPLEKHLP